MYTYHLFSSMLRPRASGFCQITDLIHLIIFMHQSQILDSILQPFIFFCFLCSLVLFFLQGHAYILHFVVKRYSLIILVNVS